MDGKGWETEPSPRLRLLRDQMESLQLQARELEMYNFMDSEEDIPITPASNSSFSEHTFDNRADLFEQRKLRMQQLEELQKMSQTFAFGGSNDLDGHGGANGPNVVKGHNKSSGSGEPEAELPRRKTIATGAEAQQPSHSKSSSKSSGPLPYLSELTAKSIGLPLLLYLLLLDQSLKSLVAVQLVPLRLNTILLDLVCLKPMKTATSLIYQQTTPIKSKIQLNYSSLLFHQCRIMLRLSHRLYSTNIGRSQCPNTYYNIY